MEDGLSKEQLHECLAALEGVASEGSQSLEMDIRCPVHAYRIGPDETEKFNEVIGALKVPATQH